ncbi:leucine-rich repeat-containing protein 71-like [Haliotis rubra]|uniref:leucine-rich repeat-containing protein 71-like n=1 Tax=Haliotis rubra TaxID=36100 RepID=UPI001EE56EA3|nr:leucine-rich repeat-containing protein 71-like [Haliotis rubra]
MEGRLNVPDNVSEGGLSSPSPVPKKTRKRWGRDEDGSRGSLSSGILYVISRDPTCQQDEGEEEGQELLLGGTGHAGRGCRQNRSLQLLRVLPVGLRGAVSERGRRVRPPDPPPGEASAVPGPHPDGKPDRGKNNKVQPPPEVQPEPLVDEEGEPVEPPPKTYTVKDKFEYFKPSIQVEMDNPDKLDTVTEIYIRGWKVDECMMNIFKQCWPAMERLHTINLWQVGLTGKTVAILASIVSECEVLKELILDGNSVEEENWYQLIGDDSSVQTLSLQHCSITDAGVEGISRALGTAKRFNTKLLSLILTGNRITDVGAEHLARGLRMNRRLMSLSLANNQIGDMGVKKIAEALSRFPLTHEELVERRRLISEKEAAEKSKAATSSRRGDRSGTSRSNSQSERDKSKRDNSVSEKDKSKRDNSQSDKDKSKRDNSQSDKDKSKRDKTPSKKSKEPKVKEEEKRVPSRKEKRKRRRKRRRKNLHKRKLQDPGMVRRVESHVTSPETES